MMSFKQLPMMSFKQVAFLPEPSSPQRKAAYAADAMEGGGRTQTTPSKFKGWVPPNRCRAAAAHATTHLPQCCCFFQQLSRTHLLSRLPSPQAHGTQGSSGTPHCGGRCRAGRAHALLLPAVCQPERLQVQLDCIESADDVKVPRLGGDAKVLGADAGILCV